MEMEQAVATFLLGTIGPMEWAIIIGIAVLIFGGKRLGNVGRGLGEGIRNFRSAVTAKDEKSVEEEKPTKSSS